MSENVKNTILRFAAIFTIILVLFGVVILRIIQLQTVHREKLEKVTAKRDSVIEYRAGRRGNIFDCNGKLLAGSVPQYYIHMDTRVKHLNKNNGKIFKQYVDSIAIGLSHIIGDMSAEEYRTKMVRAFNATHPRERDIRLTTTRVSYTQLKEINQLPLVRLGPNKSGIHVVKLNTRVKPFCSLCSRTIGGIYAQSGKGNAGIEMRFDEYLQGKDGKYIRQRVANDWEFIPIVYEEHGCDVYTTLDANMMDISESFLRERLERTQADWGCVVLMDVHTGEIKAMCNLDRGSDGQYYEMVNHAVHRMEPGSTFKTVSLMAAMEDGRISIDDTIRVWKDGWQYYDALHKDAHPLDTTLTIRQAMATSSNIALARIVTETYDGSAKKYVNTLKRMGLCDSIDYIIPGAHQAKIKVPDDSVTISRMAYGYSVELSPLQIATIYNGIANGGKMIAPVLVTQVKKDDKVIESFKTHTITNHLCSDKTLTDIRACLHDVVWDEEWGTAASGKWKLRKAQSSLVKIAGKTGTAQVVENRKYLSSKHRMSFVGYFPEDDPQYTCICVIHAPQNKGAYDSGLDCGTVVRKIAERTMVYTNEYVIDGDQLVMATKKK